MQSSILPPGQFLPEEHLSGLYQDVVMASILPDHKTFCDSIPKSSPKEILTLYHAEKNKPDFDLKSFVLENFSLPPEPAKNFCSNPELPITEHIKQLWPILTRKPDEEKSSLIPLPKPYIVPGGRFREIYYWDTFFTMLGLQESGEIAMIQNMIDNFTYLIDTMGHIPNGNRSYYASRSQPPFYPLMLDILALEKGEEVWKIYGPALKKEYEFWMEGAEEKIQKPGESYRRVVRMPDGSILNRYWDDKIAPRQECYKGDMILAKESGRAEEEVYVNMRAACESGWDFSSRWFADGKSLQTVRTTEIIPVDLNCLMYFMEGCLGKISGLEGDLKGEECYLARAEARKKAILKYFWSEEFFYDYDFMKKETMGIPTLAGVFPLYFRIAEKDQAMKAAEKLEAEFLKPGGLVTTLNHSGHQWDAPNGWAPLQWMSIKGLMNYGEDKLAKEVRERWVNLNVEVYKRTGKLMEKYNVEDVSLEGGGGKYPNQDGFGWTNGVLLKILLGKSSKRVKREI